MISAEKKNMPDLDDLVDEMTEGREDEAAAFYKSFEGEDAWSDAFIEEDFLGDDFTDEDFLRELEERAVKDVAIEGRPGSLREMLAAYSDRHLAKIAAIHGLSLPEGTDQAAVIELLAAAITDRQRFLEGILLLNETGYMFLSTLAAGKTPERECWSLPTFYGTPCRLGYCCLLKEGDQLSGVYAPQEVLALFAYLREDEAFVQELAEKQTLWEYIQGLVNLYGMVSYEQIAEIYGRETGKTVTVETLREVMAVFNRLPQFAQEYRGYVVHEILTDDQAFDNLLAQAADKPYFLPEEELIFQYADEDFCEDTPEKAALEAYLLENGCEDSLEASYLAADLQARAALDGTMEDLIAVFDDYDYEVENKKQAQKLVKLIDRLADNTRRWSLRGHSPRSYRVAMGQPDVSTQPVRVTKVGRNDPCPCGSGLKYKKCCGK